MAAHNEIGPFSHYVPQPPLSDYVDMLWIFERYSVPHAQERLMPTGAMELVIGLDDGLRMGAGIAGVQSRFMVLDTSKPFSVIGAHFKPGGGFPFFGMPAGEFQDLNVPLEAVWGSDAHEVCEQLLEAKTHEAKYRILERALLERATGRLGRHRAVRYSLTEFRNAESFRSIAEITDELGLSARRFIEVFRNEVGLTPKLYCRIARFQKVIQSLHTFQEGDLADIALSCGYFDQAHFSHDFREFSGINPSTYLRHRTPHLNHVPILD
jgi:AraC-like DNA-binding protein